MNYNSQRIGIGYDVHAFASPEDDRPLIIGGVNIDYERGLMGHSDADVLAHAISDALLGAARLGDIGEHFPDSDPKYAKANSLELLAHCGVLVRKSGWQIVDVDSVIVAQSPKMSPHRELMRKNLAAALEIDTDQVGVKATTTERLGFTGRGEGIAAESVVILTKNTCGGQIV